MNFKETIKELLKELNEHGLDRRQIEKTLNYSDKYIDQQLSKGGNEKLINSLKQLLELQKANGGNKADQQAIVNSTPKEDNSASNFTDLQKKYEQALIENVELSKAVLRMSQDISDLVKKVDGMQVAVDAAKRNAISLTKVKENLNDLYDLNAASLEALADHLTDSPQEAAKLRETVNKGFVERRSARNQKGNQKDKGIVHNHS